MTVKTCPEEIIFYMHDYLDEDLSVEEEQVLKEHLQSCADCQKHFQELKRTEAYIKSAPHIHTSDQFTAQVMARLPKEKRTQGVKRWFRHHPLLAAASLFIVLMAGSLLGAWSDDQKFSVTKNENLIVENGLVIVPEDEVVKGDIIVKNGDIHINGEVDGNITVINGEKYMAAAGNVTGNIEEIDEAFEWIWYQMKKGVKKAKMIFE